MNYDKKKTIELFISRISYPITVYEDFTTTQIPRKTEYEDFTTEQIPRKTEYDDFYDEAVPLGYDSGRESDRRQFQTIHPK